MNSVDLDVTGTKVIVFKSDGAEIKYNGPNDNFANFLWGTLIHNLTGTCNFVDEKNGIEASYTFGSVKKKPKDYFEGEIKQHGKVVSKLYGSFMGYVDFDGVRFWDGRRMQNFEILPFDDKHTYNLVSDSRKRIDSVALKAGDVDDAQVNKDKLENFQRADRKLREAAAKRRLEGGAKIDYNPYPKHPLCTKN